MVAFFEIINEKEERLRMDFDEKGHIVTDSLIISRFIQHSKRRGIRWKYDGLLIQKLKPDFNIKGVPSTQYNRIFTVEHKVNAGYPDPLDAIIYNENGSVDKYIKLPKLISDLAVKHYRTTYPNTMYFEGVKIENENIIFSIGFAMNWREERILNPETGEFGECVSSGMR